MTIGKKILAGFVTTAIACASFFSVAHAQNVLWKLDTGNLAPVLTSWGVKVPALANLTCIGTDSSGLFGAGTCSGGGGGGGTGTFSTTSNSSIIIQYPYTTLVTSLSTSATSSSKWFYDPFVNIQFINGSVGINTKTPTTVLTVAGASGVTANIYTATSSSVASTFPYASTTALTAATANILRLDNLASVGFVKTSSNGTLSVDTNTYLTGNQTITLSGDVTGSGATSITTAYNGTVPINKGGTNLTTVGASSTVLVTDGSILKYNKLSTGNFTSPNISQWTNDSGYVTSSGVTAVSATWPVLSSGGATPIVSWDGLATSTGLTAGQLLYATGVKTLGQVATTSASCSGTVSCSAFTVIGPSPITITGSGGGGSGVGTVSTSSVPTRGQLAAWSSSGAYPETLYSVATTSIGCSGNISCTGFTALGAASTIAFTGTLPIANGGTNNNAAIGASSTIAHSDGTKYVFYKASPADFTTANVSQWTNDAGYTTNTGTVTNVATNNGLTGGAITTTGTIGLDLTGITANSTILTWNGSRLTATGTVSLSAPFFIATSTTASQFPYASTTAVSGTSLCIGSDCRQAWPSSGGGAYPFGLAGNATSTLTQFNGGLTSYASSTIGNGTAIGGLTVSGNATTTGTSTLQDTIIGTAGGTSAFTIDYTGNVGIGTSTPYAALSVVGASGVVADHYTSTSTTATSTFAYGINLTTGGCFAVKGACITGGSGGSGTVTSVATNNGITGGTITNTGTIGLDITALSTNGLVTWNGSILAATGTTGSLTVPRIIATSTATSTFVGPIATASASTTATSTMAGINLPYGGCVAVGGTCLTSNTGTVTSVAASVPSVLSISGSPITTNGTLTIGYSGTALPIANGGTALTATGASSTVMTTDGSIIKYNLLTTGNFLSPNISQWTNNSGYLTVGTLPFTYPFPAGATSSLVTFNGGINIPNDTSLNFAGGSPCANSTGLKAGSDGTFLFDAGCSIKFKGGSALTWGYTDGSFNYVFRSDSLGNTTQSGFITVNSNTASVLPYASTTAQTVSGAFYIPQSAAPTLITTGQIAVNTTQASSSLRYYDGTATRALFPTVDKTFVIASSTFSAYKGLGATSTISWGVSLHSETWLEAGCFASSTGTGGIQFTDTTGNKMEYVPISSTPTIVTLATNNQYIRGEKRSLDIRAETSLTQDISCTVTVRRDAD